MRRELALLVMDELRIYRGRQGADVAMLFRRVRQRQAAGDGAGQAALALLETLQNTRRARRGRGAMSGIMAITGGRRGIGAASAMRRTGRNAVREATARVERRGPKRSTAPPPDSHGGAAAAVGQPTPWTMCSGSVPPRGASGKRLSRKR